MNKEELLNRVNQTACKLYQNQERDGITEVGQLLSVFQSMIQNMSEQQMDECGDFAVVMLRELLESYKCQDVLGMADCLMKKSILFVQYYFQAQNIVK